MGKFCPFSDLTLIMQICKSKYCTNNRECVQVQHNETLVQRYIICPMSYALYPVSYILCPTSYIFRLHPRSYVLLPIFYVLLPSSYSHVLHLMFYILLRSPLRMDYFQNQDIIKSINQSICTLCSES